MERLKRGRYAGRTKNWKEQMRDKQIKPRREDEKESVKPTEKRVMTELEKVYFVRYGKKPDWME